MHAYVSICMADRDCMWWERGVDGVKELLASLDTWETSSWRSDMQLSSHNFTSTFIARAEWWDYNWHVLFPGSSHSESSDRLVLQVCPIFHLRYTTIDKLERNRQEEVSLCWSTSTIFVMSENDHHGIYLKRQPIFIKIKYKHEEGYTVNCFMSNPPMEDICSLFS